VQRLNAFTVDVEDYFHVAAFSAAIDRTQWDTLPRRVADNTRRLLDILDEAGMWATFFVLGWVAERHPDLVREIHRRGHEVASHGSSHKLIYEQTPQEFREETRRSKQILEDQTGTPLSGYRAASYSIVKTSLWALDVIAEAGFEYDSSIVPTHHDLYGIPGAQALPHRLTTQGGATLVEFPPSTYRLLGVNVPVGGGGYFRLYPYRLTRYFLRRINRTRRAPFIFYLHPWEIDPGQPRVHASIRSRFRHYLNLDRTEVRLRQLARDFRFGTVRAVLQDLRLLSA
jgi:polysaccharide deacetylase family protein (PEP-CTERM system associated)